MVGPKRSPDLGEVSGELNERNCVLFEAEADRGGSTSLAAS